MRVADSLSVTRMPESRHMVLERTLHRARCGRCDHGFVVDKPVLYTDFSRGLWISVMPVVDRVAFAVCEREATSVYRTAFARGPAIVHELARQTRPRLVFGYEELREKVIAADHGLDDAVLEVLKIEALLSSSDLLRDEALATLLLEDLPEPAVLRFRVARRHGEPEATPRFVHATRDGYDALAEQRDALAPYYRGLFDKPWCSLLRFRTDHGMAAGA